MIKKFVFVILGLFLPIIIIFTFYRSTLGLGPFSFKYVMDILSTKFSNTGESLSVIVRDLTANLNSLFQSISNVFNGDSRLEEVVAVVGDTWFTDILMFFYRLFNVPLQAIGLILDLMVDFARFMFFFVQDFVSVLDVLSTFLFGVSPYPVEPYFPTA